MPEVPRNIPEARLVIRAMQWDMRYEEVEHKIYHISKHCLVHLGDVLSRIFVDGLEEAQLTAEGHQSSNIHAAMYIQDMASMGP